MAAPDYSGLPALALLLSIYGIIVEPEQIFMPSAFPPGLSLMVSASAANNPLCCIRFFLLEGHRIRRLYDGTEYPFQRLAKIA